MSSSLLCSDDYWVYYYGGICIGTEGLPIPPIGGLNPGGPPINLGLIIGPPAFGITGRNPGAPTGFVYPPTDYGNYCCYCGFVGFFFVWTLSSDTTYLASISPVSRSFLVY